MASKVATRRIQLTEYGKPQSVERRHIDLRALAEANKYWSRALGLREYPIDASETSDGKILLRAKAVTGVVRLGMTDIEIAPKFLSSVDNLWQSALWQILTVVHGGYVDSALTSGAEISTFSVADLLAEMFLASYGKGAARGLPRGYATSQATGPVLKGSLDLSRIEQVLTTPGHISYITDELTDDTSIARLLRWTSDVLSPAVSHHGRARQLREISSSLSHVGKRPPHIMDARRLRLGIQHQALETARIVGVPLLDGAGVHHAKGGHALPGFLWNSDVIYENYVFWLCKQAAMRRGERVTKSSEKFGEVVSGVGPVLETTPDAVFRDSLGKPTAIADAKYKNFGLRPKASDTYQILTAGHVLGCERVSLTYPVAEPRLPIKWQVPSSLGGRSIELTALPLNLMNLAGPDGHEALIMTIYEWLDDD